MELTPSALASFIKKNLPNTKIIVKGEVSQPKISSGHMYFNLKDNFTANYLKEKLISKNP